MGENITITIANGKQSDIITTSGYLLIHLSGEEFKFSGSLNVKDLAPLLLKIAMDKMSNRK